MNKNKNYLISQIIILISFTYRVSRNWFNQATQVCISGREFGGILFWGNINSPLSKSIFSKKIKLLPYRASYFSYFPQTQLVLLGRVSVWALVINRCECNNLWDFHEFLKPFAELCGLPTDWHWIAWKAEKHTHVWLCANDHISIKVTVTTEPCDN